MTNISVTFSVPEKAWEILRLLEEQNSELEFYLEEGNRSITLIGDLVDFKPYQNDWDDYDEIETLINE